MTQQLPGDVNEWFHHELLIASRRQIDGGMRSAEEVWWQSGPPILQRQGIQHEVLRVGYAGEGAVQPPATHCRLDAQLW